MRKQREESDETADVPPDEGYQCLNASDAHMDLEVCLKALNETERTVVLLFYVEDQPLKKIADITSLPLGTIKSYLSRARVKMAKVLNQ
jgi:RNA polymerase sigma-70 factor (ECF subfamily)